MTAAISLLSLQLQPPASASRHEEVWMCPCLRKTLLG